MLLRNDIIEVVESVFTLGDIVVAASRCGFMR